MVASCTKAITQLYENERIYGTPYASLVYCVRLATDTTISHDVQEIPSFIDAGQPDMCGIELQHVLIAGPQGVGGGNFLDAVG